MTLGLLSLKCAGAPQWSYCNKTCLIISPPLRFGIKKIFTWKKNYDSFQNLKVLDSSHTSSGVTTATEVIESHEWVKTYFSNLERPKMTNTLAAMMTAVLEEWCFYSTTWQVSGKAPSILLIEWVIAEGAKKELACFAHQSTFQKM